MSSFLSKILLRSRIVLVRHTCISRSRDKVYRVQNILCKQLLIKILIEMSVMSHHVNKNVSSTKCIPSSWSDHTDQLYVDISSWRITIIAAAGSWHGSSLRMKPPDSPGDHLRKSTCGMEWICSINHSFILYTCEWITYTWFTFFTKVVIRP